MSDSSLKQSLRWNRFDPTGGLRHLMPPAAGGSIRSLVSMNLRYWDCLLPNQQLVINDQLESNNHYVNLIMQGDGNLVLYRKEYSWTLWASNTGPPVTRAVMQGDGNLVTCAPTGVSYWNTGTSGYPGAWVVVQDDGNLVVYDSANKSLWASNTVQDFSSPTFRYFGDDGYQYVETSESWKVMCSGLPCFDAIRWPDYASTHIDVTIDNEPVVIQLWKGWCQRFLGLKNFPGGFGGEVGVYRRMPGRARPSTLPYIPKELADFILSGIAKLGDDDIWWPYPELNAQLEFTLINPKNNQIFFHAGPETSYWLAKWMDEDSYMKYKRAQGKTPMFSKDYIMDYKITGKRSIISGRW